MTVTSQISTIQGKFTVEYRDADDFNKLPYKQCTQVYGVCFYQDLVIVAKTTKGSWILPGGTIELGETFEQALVREVHEESNMKVLFHQPIGYQKVWADHDEPIYQLRYYCQVEPYGPFVKDLASDGGNIVAIKGMIPDQVAELLNWREIGHQIMERAARIHARLD